MAIDGKIGRRVNVQCLYMPEKEVVCTHRETGFSPENIPIERVFSDSVGRATYSLTNPSGMRNTRCKVHLGLRLAECCNAEEFMSESLDSRSASLSSGIPEKSGRSCQTRRLRGFWILR